MLLTQYRDGFLCGRGWVGKNYSAFVSSQGKVVLISKDLHLAQLVLLHARGINSGISL